MTNQEKDIWNAVYGVCFAEGDPHTSIYLSAINAIERSIERANDAVRALRDRRKTGDPNAGKKVIS